MSSMSPTTRLCSRLRRGAVEPDVLPGPARRRTRRCGWTAPRSGRSARVARITAGLDPQRAGQVVGDLVPVQEEAARVRVEEHVPGQVQRQLVVVETAALQRPAQVVRGEEVHPRVADVGRRSVIPARIARPRAAAARSAPRRARDGPAGGVRARSNRCCRSASSSCSARATRLEHRLGGAGRGCRVRAGRSSRRSPRRAWRPPRDAGPGPGGWPPERRDPPAPG